MHEQYAQSGLHSLRCLTHFLIILGEDFFIIVGLCLKQDKYEVSFDLIKI